MYKPLYKTTIVIWSDHPTDKYELVGLAREATSGSMYCSTQRSVLVQDPSTDDDWDGTEFFGDYSAPNPLTLQDFWFKVREEQFHHNNPLNLRLGQVAFNLLHRERPELAGLIRGTHVDPSHASDERDLRWKDFVKYLKENWDLESLDKRMKRG